MPPEAALVLLHAWARANAMPRGVATAFDAAGDAWSCTRGDDGAFLLVREVSANKRLQASEDLDRVTRELAQATRLERQLGTSHRKDAAERLAEARARVVELTEARDLLREAAKSQARNYRVPLDLASLEVRLR